MFLKNIFIVAIEPSSAKGNKNDDECERIVVANRCNAEMCAQMKATAAAVMANVLECDLELDIFKCGALRSTAGQ